MRGAPAGMVAPVFVWPCLAGALPSPAVGLPPLRMCCTLMPLPALQLGSNNRYVCLVVAEKRLRHHSRLVRRGCATTAD